jgi:hypothetical protein
MDKLITRTGLQIEGLLAYFTHLKRIGDDIGDVRYVLFLPPKKFFFLGVKMTPLICFIHLMMQEYDSNCLKMYLITLRIHFTSIFFAPITKGKVNEGESNTPCPSTLEVTYSSG